MVRGHIGPWAHWCVPFEKARVPSKVRKRDVGKLSTKLQPSLAVGAYNSPTQPAEMGAGARLHWSRVRTHKKS